MYICLSGETGFEGMGKLWRADKAWHCEKPEKTIGGSLALVEVMAWIKEKMERS